MSLVSPSPHIKESGHKTQFVLWHSGFLPDDVFFYRPVTVAVNIPYINYEKLMNIAFRDRGSYDCFLIGSHHFLPDTVVLKEFFLQMGDDCMVLPTVPEDQITKVFPQGVTQVAVPSGKKYLRKTSCPAMM